ncbi:protein turtle homolog A-like isoform X1 [Centruroides vittatus]|uniref:protein turtle homolog A-like isoform X1 n=1 Tax=Centruroides vittatus TaxID=120091 RepID=UPI00350F39E3
MEKCIYFILSLSLTLYILLTLFANLGNCTANITGNLLTIIGVAGEKVKLPCDITPPTPDDDVSLILWYKDDFVAPIYSLDGRRRRLSQARHAVNDAIASRSYLSIGHKPAMLELNPVTLEDDGHYRCRVDFKKAQTRNADLILRVIVPPKKPIITNKKGELLQSLIGPYNEGSELELICEADGGKPRPSVTWWRESVLLDDTFELTSDGVVRNELKIPVLQRNDLMAMFTCQAANSNFTPPLSTAVTIDMNFKPVEVKIKGEFRSVSARKPVEIECNSKGSRPAATITWWKGSTRMTSTRDRFSLDGSKSTSILTFTPTLEDNGKYLSCRAENPHIPGSATEDGWTLEVHYVPQITMKLGSKLRHTHIQEGNDVYFECNIRANPWVSEITWRLEGQQIQTNISAGIIVSNQSLVLQKVRRISTGRYTCMATNTEGEGESNPIHLRVQYAPICVPDQKQFYGAARDEIVKVSCELEADPPEVKFRWEFNTSLELEEILAFSVEGTRSVAFYTPHSQYDYGSLLCWGKNGVGSQKEPCVFTIFPAGPPESVQNCTVINKTEESLHVECIEGYDGGLKQRFFMDVLDADSEVVQTSVNSDFPIFFAHGLLPGANLLLIIHSVNDKGMSLPVRLHTVTLTPPASNERRDDIWTLALSPILIVLIAVVVGIFLVVIVIYTAKKLRRKSYTEEAMNLRRKNYKFQNLFSKEEDVYKETGEEKCPDIIPDIKADMYEREAKDNKLVVETKISCLSGKERIADSLIEKESECTSNQNRVYDNYTSEVIAFQNAVSNTPDHRKTKVLPLSLKEFESGHCTSVYLPFVNSRQTDV